MLEIHDKNRGPGGNRLLIGVSVPSSGRGLYRVFLLSVVLLPLPLSILTGAADTQVQSLVTGTGLHQRHPAALQRSARQRET